MKLLNEDLKQGTFKQMYLLYGEERYLRRQYKKRLQEALCGEDDAMNTHFYDGKDVPVGEIIDLAETMPFLASRRVIFLTDSGLFKSGGEQMAAYLAQPNETAFFVFTESEVDKRSKLYKTVQSKGRAVECSTQNEAALRRWIGSCLTKEGKKMTESSARLFLSKTGTDMDSIQMELEKLICYCIDREVITDGDIEAVCTVHITNHIFDMVDAIADRQPKKALSLYYDLLALREPPMRILFLIARQCNLLLQTKELHADGYDVKAMASRLGVPPFAVKKYLSQSARFQAVSLQRAVKQCVEAEEAVKSGRMNDKMSVEILILSVL